MDVLIEKKKEVGRRYLLLEEQTLNGCIETLIHPLLNEDVSLIYKYK